MIYYIVKKNSCHAKFKKNGYKQLGRAQNIILASEEGDLEVIDTETKYARGSAEVNVVNILSGLQVSISASEVGSCCDPSTERYHSM
jgi:hypothetical protein